jgi:hypothetical protein
MQAIMSDQRASYLEIASLLSANRFFIGHLLLMRYINGPGCEGPATPFRKQENLKIKRSRPPNGKASGSWPHMPLSSQLRALPAVVRLV